VRSRFSLRLVMQRSWCLSRWQPPANGRNRCPSGRPRFSAVADSPVGAVGSQASAFFPSNMIRRSRRWRCAFLAIGGWRRRQNPARPAAAGDPQAGTPRTSVAGTAAGLAGRLPRRESIRRLGGCGGPGAAGETAASGGGWGAQAGCGLGCVAGGHRRLVAGGGR
jgi:hypothetical protein